MYERDYADEHSWEELEEDEHGNLRSKVLLMFFPLPLASAAAAAGGCRFLPCSTCTAALTPQSHCNHHPPHCRWTPMRHSAPGGGACSPRPTQRASAAA